MIHDIPTYTDSWGATFLTIKDKTISFYYTDSDLFYQTLTNTYSQKIESIKITSFFGSATTNEIKITYWGD
jgi:hypothetical protein